MVSLGPGALPRRRIVTPQHMKNIRRFQLQRIVRLLLLINQKWERDSRLCSKHSCILRIAQAHCRQRCTLRPKLLLVRAQLRDVFAAENSTVVSQEHHYRRLRCPQRPQPDLPPIRIWQHNHRQSAAQRFIHLSSLCKEASELRQERQKLAQRVSAGEEANHNLQVP